MLGKDAVTAVFDGGLALSSSGQDLNHGLARQPRQRGSLSGRRLSSRRIAGEAIVQRDEHVLDRQPAADLSDLAHRQRGERQVGGIDIVWKEIPFLSFTNDLDLSMARVEDE